MKYPQLAYVDESEDPSLTLETSELIVKVIDNTGLSLRRNEGIESCLGSYGFHEFVPFSHHLGYHGIRSLYDKEERRNIVSAFLSWLNLQTVVLEGIENDPVDERSWAGVGRGWPMRMEQRDKGALLTIDPMPCTQFQYTLELQPVEPNAIDFSIRFVFHRRPESGPCKARFSWPCYMNGLDDVAFHYPCGKEINQFKWSATGEKPEVILGDPVGYVHAQTAFRPTDQILPVGYGRIGDKALTIMFSDPTVCFFVVNAGGHMSYSSVQNPAWDFEYAIENYPLNQPIGFDGRLIYSNFEGEDQVLEHYLDWANQRAAE